MSLKHLFSHKKIAIFSLILLFLSILPLLVISFFNHPSADDFAFSAATHQAWVQGGGVYFVFRSAIRFTAYFRQAWEGTYTTTFLSTLQPAIFGSQFYFITTWLMLATLLCSIGLFLHQFLSKLFSANAYIIWIIFSLLSFFTVQLMPSASEAFFWFNGAIAYLFMWCIMLVRWSFLIALSCTTKKTSQLLYALALTLLTVVIGGAKYSNLLFALSVDFFVVLFSFVYRQRFKFFYLALWLVLIACTVFSASAQGNIARAELLNTPTLSFFKAIAQSFYFGSALIGQQLSLPIIMLWLLSSILLFPYLKKSTFCFKYPILFTLLCFALFCTQLTPTLYMKLYLGSGRVVNTYWTTFVLLGLVVCMYWSGFIAQLHVNFNMSFVPSFKKIIFILLFCSLCMLNAFQPQGANYPGVQNLASVSAFQSLFSGQAQKFNQAMKLREYELEHHKSIDSIPTIYNEPWVFMSDTLKNEHQSETISNFKEYYNLKNKK